MTQHRRTIQYDRQPARVMAYEVDWERDESPADQLFLDAQLATLAIAESQARGRETYAMNCFLHRQRGARIWCSATAETVVVVAIEVTRDGGKTYFDPLSWPDAGDR